MQSNTKQNEYTKALVTAFARAWVEFYNEKAL